MPVSFQQLFPVPKSIIAMVHLRALPGTPAWGGSMQEVVQQASAEAQLLAGLGVHGLLIENMHDTPYLAREVGPEIIAAMTAVGLAVKAAAPQLPCGVQVLAGANQAALAVAQAAGLNFIRAEGFVFGHVADEGWMNSDAGELLRYRRQIGAEDIPIWTDIKKKHSSHAITSDIDLVETAKAADFFRTDGLIVTGTATGTAAALADVQNVHQALSHLPTIIGSGITADNISDYLPFANAFIVGSHLKKDGNWQANIDVDRVCALLGTRTALLAEMSP